MKVEKCKLCQKVEAGELISIAELMESQDRDALHLFWYKTHNHPVRIARKLFPTKPRGYVTATIDLGHYASNKSAAIQCRLTGNIQAALVYENICDTIHTILPNYARW